MEVDEGSDQKSDIKPHWIAAHAPLKNDFMEDEKYHNLMSWLNHASISGLAQDGPFIRTNSARSSVFNSSL